MMTWGEFKLAMEKAGAKDEHDISYIDISFPLRILVRLPGEGPADPTGLEVLDDTSGD
jgi:hypothetical protein